VLTHAGIVFVACRTEFRSEREHMRLTDQTIAWIRLGEPEMLRSNQIAVVGRAGDDVRAETRLAIDPYILDSGDGGTCCAVGEDLVAARRRRW
jgi:hypothetical protein